VKEFERVKVKKMIRGQFDWVRKGKEPTMCPIEMTMCVVLGAAKGCLDILEVGIMWRCVLSLWWVF
jgi:hypothetical protein